MSDELSVVEFDGDEAVAEAIAGIEDSKRTRSGLFRGAGALAGVGAFAALLPRSASARSGGSKANDVKILNYALTLEYLEAAFYAEALRVGGYTGAVGRFASVVASHEATHVATLKGVLGSKAVKSPSFDFKGTTRKWSTFLRTAKVLEDTGVAAYQGQAPLIHQNAVLGPAGAILAVEARHAAWVRDLLYAGKSVKPAPEAFSTPMSMSQVLSAVKQTGFIKS
ncbi:ferritin-like domain-containing protein [Solirubrobacter ginsenosidimutans]|uniref:Ferritin-like domain-containing protein n=1 Tax=Solirubrobacter ginsenosidimutans TaxID=490573 RepID=A0A9X3RZN1_9ACTN|nr:ferritin-like domain-containing protein [Solirubrobacter ginsenosidimutans]MDA0159107.1 ferritin-like domain-containing protein [Solirubrobacter ginsenosidimutans]